MDYGYVLRRAWEITWRHRVLWLFGFLVALGNVSARFNLSGNWRVSRRELPPEVQRALSEFIRSPHFVVVIALLALLGLLVGLGLALLRALGRAALVDMVRQVEDTGTTSGRAGWRSGRRRMLPVFLIGLLMGLPPLLIGLAGAAPVVIGIVSAPSEVEAGPLPPGYFTWLGGMLCCLLPVLCLAVLVAIPLDVLRRLATRACVLEEQRVLDSIRRGWTLLRENLGPVALLWLIFLLLGLLVGVVVGLPLLLLAAAILVPLALTVLVSPLLFILLAFLLGLILWVVGAAIGGLVETYVSTAWTLAYREWTGLGRTGEIALAA